MSNSPQWIDIAKMDELLSTLVESVKTSRNMALEKVKQNVEDPFLLLCVASAYGIHDIETLRNRGAFHSVSTAISSAIGRFHQGVLGAVHGFVDLNAGYDVESRSRKILAEIKNKHNTMNAANRERIVETLKIALRSRPGYKGYLVAIIPKRPERYTNELGGRLYETDGASFYELVTGDRNALKQLYGIVEDRLCSVPDIAGYCRVAFNRGVPE